MNVLSLFSIGRCDWTAGPGPWRDAGKAAEKRTRAGHPTATFATPGGAT